MKIYIHIKEDVFGNSYLKCINPPKNCFEYFSYFSIFQTLPKVLNLLFIRNLTLTYLNFTYSEENKASEFDKYLLHRISILQA